MFAISLKRAFGLLVCLTSCAPQAREVKPSAAYAETALPEAMKSTAPASSSASASHTAPSSHAGSSSSTETKPEAFAVRRNPASDQSGSAPLPPVTPTFPRNLPEIAPFYEALDALGQGERKLPVRIVWWGDSHTAADFLTHPIRQHLDSHLRSGGPGFIRLGLQGYRHGAVRLTQNGRWRKAPILPAQRTRVLDGVFGLGGIRTLPAAGASATAELRTREQATMRWTLSYRLPKGAQIEVKLGQQVERLRSNEDTAAQLRSSAWEASASETFSVRHIGGDPEIMGAFVETVVPGVVFDTIGINGARIATILAWEPEQLIEQIALRDPELLVLAFGTNEVFDNTKVSHYADHIAEVVALARKAKPQLSCWVVGPPDSASTAGGSKERVSQVTEVQRAAAAEQGCAFTSQYELMGGEGSFKRWIDMRPTRARTDRVHLSIAGYEALGDMLAQELLASSASNLSENVGSPEKN